MYLPKHMIEEAQWPAATSYLSQTVTQKQSPTTNTEIYRL